MARFDFAYIEQRGAGVIIVPVDRTFAQGTDLDRNAAIEELETRCRSAGLPATVVPVWECGENRMAFMAPRALHAFFKRINLDWVRANVNCSIAW
jgi:hypothetical protein